MRVLHTAPSKQRMAERMSFEVEDGQTSKEKMGVAKVVSTERADVSGILLKTLSKRSLRGAL